MVIWNIADEDDWLLSSYCHTEFYVRSAAAWPQHNHKVGFNNAECLKLCHFTNAVDSMAVNGTVMCPVICDIVP